MNRTLIIATAIALTAGLAVVSANDANIRQGVSSLVSVPQLGELDGAGGWHTTEASDGFGNRVSIRQSDGAPFGWSGFRGSATITQHGTRSFAGVGRYGEYGTDPD